MLYVRSTTAPQVLGLLRFSLASLRDTAYRVW
jgi:hypothetical protein